MADIRHALHAYRETHGLRRLARKAASLPPLASVRNYRLTDLPHDIVAGAVIAALSIPVAMGYAQIAGLTPVYGLYASILPAIIFAVVTNTRSIVFGMDSAAVAVTGGVIVSAGVALGSEQAFAIMPMLTILVAAFLLLFAITRAGNLVHYVPEPVMSGFILGISITIIVHQVPKLVGAASFDVFNLAAFIPQINVASAVLAAFAICALFFIGSYAPKLPGSLIVLVIGLAFSVGFNLEDQGVAVLGDMPVGLPSLAFPEITGLGVVVMVGGAFSIAITVAVESLLTLNTFTQREGTRAHGNRELISLSLGNVASSFIGCPPCSASLSRTAAAKSSGGVSQLAGIFGAGIIAAFVLVLSPYLRSLPAPVLASIIVYAMVQVIDFATIKRLARKVRGELAILMFVAAVVIAFGAIAGIAAGIALSLGINLVRSRASANAKLVGFEGGEPDEHIRVPANMIVYRMRGSLSFTNIDRILQEVRRLIIGGVDTVIFEISDVRSVDSTAADAMRQFIRALSQQGIYVRIVRSLALSNDHYTRYELRRMMKGVSIYPTVQSAIDNVSRKKRKQMVTVPVERDQ